MDEFVVCWEKHVQVEDMVSGIVVRVRRVMVRLLRYVHELNDCSRMNASDLKNEWILIPCRVGG